MWPWKTWWLQKRSFATCNLLEPAIRHGNIIHFIIDTKVPWKVPLIISRFLDKSKQTRKIHAACLTTKASCNVRRLNEGWGNRILVHVTDWQYGLNCCLQFPWNIEFGPPLLSTRRAPWDITILVSKRNLWSGSIYWRYSMVRASHFHHIGPSVARICWTSWISLCFIASFKVWTPTITVEFLSSWLPKHGTSDKYTATTTSWHAVSFLQTSLVCACERRTKLSNKRIVGRVDWPFIWQRQSW